MTENKVETNNTTQAIKKPQTFQNSSNSISNCQLSNSSSTTAEVNHQVLQRLLLIVHQTQIVVQVLRLRAVGQSSKMSVTVNPSNADNKSVTFSSSNSGVATVDGNNIVSKAAGTIYITAKSNENGILTFRLL